MKVPWCALGPKRGRAFRPLGGLPSDHTNPAQIRHLPALACPPRPADTTSVPATLPHGPTRRWSPSTASFSRVLLVTSLGLIALATWFAFAAAFRSAANTRQLLTDYAAFAAWSYRQHLTTALEEASWTTLNPVAHEEMHRDRQTPPVERLAGYRDMQLEMCKCGSAARPASYFRFSLLDAVVTTAGAPLAEAQRVQLPANVRAILGTGAARPRTGLMRLPQNTLAAYTLMPTEWGDTIVYGFTFDSLGLAAEFDSVLQQATLLPAAVTHGRPNAALLTLEVRDSAGALFHRGAAWPADEREWPYIAADTLPGPRGGFVVRLTLIPEAAPLLLSGGLPRTPLPLLVLVGALGVGAALVAVAQIRREAELSRLRSNFVAGVSHELRTPLAQIRLFLDTLRLRRYDTEEEHQWLIGHLTRETTRLEHLVENVLAASRLDQGLTGEVALEPVDLAREAEEAVRDFAPLAASRQVKLTTSLTPDLQVLADPDGLRQLLLNLLDNAVKFGPAGQTVEIRLARTGDQASLSVHDSGPGIPAADHDRIWEPYYRGSHEAARAVGGSGIGLAIVREMTARFTGSIAVESPASGGAVFVLTLPLISPHPTAS